MSVVLAIDVGGKRIGLAIGSRATGIATPLETVEARPRPAAVQRITEIIAERGVDELVVGLPLELDGREGHAVRKTRAFISELTARVALPVHEWDERFTSVAAERSLVESDVRRAKRKDVIDQVAATLLLQGFLDAGPRA